MFARLGPSQPAQGADVIARTMGALALISLAVIHVVDLPPTLGPTPLVGVGYVGIIIMLVVLAAWLGRSPAASVPEESRPAVRRAPEYSQRG